MQILYSIYVGGDAWEYFGGSNRYLTVVMPLYFILISFVFFEIKKIFSGGKYRLFGFYFLLSISFIVMNTYAADMARDWLGISGHQTVGGNQMNVMKSVAIEKIAEKRANAAVVWAGTLPYFSNEIHFIDVLGKNDKHIARETSINFLNTTELPFWNRFVPGHTKWDYKYSIIEKQPDIIVQEITDDYETVLFTDKNYGRIRRGHMIFLYKLNSENVDITKL